MVKGTRQSLPAGHLLAALGAAEVDLHAGVELAQRAVEELARRIGAAVPAGALVHTLVREVAGAEGDNGLGGDVGHEGGRSPLLQDGRGTAGTHVLVPGVLVVDVDGHEAVDEVLEDGRLVGVGRVGLPDGDNLLHGGVEEGGAGLREARLNYRHSRALAGGLEQEEEGLGCDDVGHHDNLCWNLAQSIFLQRGTGPGTSVHMSVTDRQKKPIRRPQQAEGVPPLVL